MRHDYHIRLYTRYEKNMCTTNVINAVNATVSAISLVKVSEVSQIERNRVRTD